MALKYTIAASAALISDPDHQDTPSFMNLKLIFNLTFENILRCLRDNDDDVRHVASTALDPVSSILTRLLAPVKNLKNQSYVYLFSFFCSFLCI
jgi:hypothetical protein